MFPYSYFPLLFLFLSIPTARCAGLLGTTCPSPSRYLLSSYGDGHTPTHVCHAMVYVHLHRSATVGYDLCHLGLLLLDRFVYVSVHVYICQMFLNNCVFCLQKTYVLFCFPFFKKERERERERKKERERERDGNQIQI